LKKLRYLVLALIVLTVACSLPAQLSNPPWVWKLILQFQLQPVGNPPQSIWEYEWEGRTVYYMPPQCCDMFSSLYEADGTYICAPDGGLNGKGDGRCPTFQTERTNEQLVWKDPRGG
jgi:hypothetical protein